MVLTLFRHRLLPVVRQRAEPELLGDPQEGRVPQNVEVEALGGLTYIYAYIHI